MCINVFILPTCTECTVTGTKAFSLPTSRLNLEENENLLVMQVEPVNLTVPAPTPHTPITKRTLNTADPKIVPTPMSPFVMKTPVKRERKNISLCAELLQPEVTSQ